MIESGDSLERALAALEAIAEFGLMLQEHDARLELDEMSRRLPPDS